MENDEKASVSSVVEDKWPCLDVLKTTTSPQVQEAAVHGLVQRLLGHRAAEFTITVQPDLGPKDRDTYRLQNGEGRTVHVTGSSGIAAALGVHNYLKQWCGCHIAWSGSQLDTPTPLPAISEPVQVTTQDRFRYYQNACTVSYSFAWWQWPRWEKEIDWMALNAINLPLAFTGQEAIWWRVYELLGFSDEELQEFFAGPAFFAWQRMGNIDGWGGPLKREFVNAQLALQHKILQRMRDFGMIPVLPAFSGHVPKAIERKFAMAKVTPSSNWADFPSQYANPYLLDPTDPLFQTIGDAFMTEMKNEFGLDHVYNCDTFNENKPSSDDHEYIQSLGNAVFAGMRHTDPDAIWLMQGWMFLYDSFWEPPQAEALLTSVPIGRMIVLDLQAELSPMYGKYESFYGQPFIWCMLHNFGGVSGLYGAIENLNNQPFQDRFSPNSTMIGTGLAMEGIEQNEVIYEFMNEMAWRSEPVNLKEWVTDYATRRYGAKNECAAAAWDILQSTIYNCKDGHKHFGRYLIVKRPAFTMWWPTSWYERKDLLAVWENMIEAGSELGQSHLYRHDLTDITREVLQTLAKQFYFMLKHGLISKNLGQFELGRCQILELLNDMETLLAADDHFLLGTWLESAKALGETKEDKKLLEYNARNQITLWGPTGNILDYAAKQWSGLFKSYYIPRWELFIDQMKEALKKDKPFQQHEFDELVFKKVEEPFTRDRTIFPTTAVGDTLDIVNNLYSKWQDFVLRRDVNTPTVKEVSHQRSCDVM